MRTRLNEARILSAPLAMLGMMILAGCTPHRQPPPSRSFQGLPVSGTLADARRAGFTRCISDPVSMRCRLSDIKVEGEGTYEAAVDLVGSDGNGGFDILTMWSDRGETALFAAGEALERKGWRSCILGHGDVGEQQVFTHPHVPFFYTMDISYWMHRRLRLIPIAGAVKPPC
jgi:hypothetical protein